MPTLPLLFDECLVFVRTSQHTMSKRVWANCPFACEDTWIRSTPCDDCGARCNWLLAGFNSDVVAFVRSWSDPGGCAAYGLDSPPILVSVRNALSQFEKQ